MSRVCVAGSVTFGFSGLLDRFRSRLGVRGLCGPLFMNAEEYHHSNNAGFCSWFLTVATPPFERSGALYSTCRSGQHDNESSCASVRDPMNGVLVYFSKHTVATN